MMKWQHPLPQLGLKYSYYTTYIEGIISQFIQEAMDHVDPRPQLLFAQAQDRASIDTH